MASGLEDIVGGRIFPISFITQKVVIEVPPHSEISPIDQILTRLEVAWTVERCTFSRLWVLASINGRKKAAHKHPSICLPFHLSESLSPNNKLGSSSWGMRSFWVRTQDVW